GNLVLDENGNPIPLIAPDAPVEYEKDEAGNLVLDENGDPIPAVPEKKPEQLPLPEVTIWMEAPENVETGAQVTLHSEVTEYAGAYTRQWQYALTDDAGEMVGDWINIGEGGETFTFTVSEENMGWFWRMELIVETPETQPEPETEPALQPETALE
ncbi:MAG: hypothetical protein RSC90_11460, partial [Clostridia bacterium]